MRLFRFLLEKAFKRAYVRWPITFVLAVHVKSRVAVKAPIDVAAAAVMPCSASLWPAHNTKPHQFRV